MACRGLKVASNACVPAQQQRTRKTLACTAQILPLVYLRMAGQYMTDGVAEHAFLSALRAASTMAVLRRLVLERSALTARGLPRLLQYRLKDTLQYLSLAGGWCVISVIQHAFVCCDCPVDVVVGLAVAGCKAGLCVLYMCASGLCTRARCETHFLQRLLLS